MSIQGRLITAMVTPFTSDGALDIAGAKALADHLLAEGNDGIVVAGSTGESPTLTGAEKQELLAAVLDVARGRGEVIMGTGTYSTATTIEASVGAHAGGADGLLVVTPYYNRPPQRGLLEHFRAVARATPLPIILYDIPIRTARKIEHETLLELLREPTIIGVKDAAADLAGTTRLCADKPGDTLVWSGDDALTLPMLAVGAHGVISVAGHIVGREIRAMLDAYSKGDIVEAARIGGQLAPVFDVLFIDSNPIPLKAALAMKGLPAGLPRSPLAPATSDQIEQIRAVLTEARLL
jgi:4-hydroxy-tetrahydrodipicolinate synthase